MAESQITELVKDKVKQLRVLNKKKIFCIGHNKTGTTSLAKSLKEFGYILGSQRRSELLIHDYKIRNFKPIINYCKTAEVFQDVPFSLPYLYVTLDQSFPGSKFILTVRDSDEQWYNSLIKFQTKLFGKDTVPNKEDLLKQRYRYDGYVYDTKNIIYGTTDDDIFNKQKLINFYNTHNAAIKEYFRFRKEDLLILNLSDLDSYQELCSFLDKKPLRNSFPWENKS